MANAIRAYVIATLVVLVISKGVGGETVEAEELVRDTEYDLRVLSKQVKALLERRSEDLKSIEESVRRTVFNGPEVEELRDQVKSLKQEIEQLRSGQPLAAPTPQTKNEKLTVKWLSNAIFEIKNEMGELQQVVNSTALLQTHELHESQMGMLRSDLKSLNSELDQFRILNAKKDAELTVIKEEFNVLRSDWKSMAVLNAKMRHQLKSLQLEWSHNWKQLQEQPLPPLAPENATHSRHQKIMRHHIIHLEKATKHLQEENTYLKTKLNKLEMKVRASDNFDRINGNDIQNYIASNKIQEIQGETKETILKQLSNVTDQQTINTESIANLSKQVTDFEKLHLSMLELLENVENLENKVDKVHPEFRKEISKIEIQTSQMSADTALLKEENRNIKESMQAISFSVSKLQEKSSAEEETLERLQEHLKVLENSDVMQNSRLHDHILKEESSTMDTNATKATIHLVEELRTFESEYKSIVNKLPRSCDSVNGPKGVYLISPGDGEPILAHCEDRWTTIQKRHDGNINFNRKWNEYSNGFGSATGDHWIGNRNLHYLTKDNCTMLKINMKDVYGKYWEAVYDRFHVADYTDGFRLTVSHYHGNASDAMNYQNKMEFSTVDNDRDISNTHCASNYEGGWWFSHCQQANLNGNIYDLTWFDSARNQWIAVAQSEMKIKRRDVC
ncbi:protein scabrous [Anthonomus grandis grandis]|uniref:protein scabrous n=1 Tax=Anthonomus grandis grandis TaxID=2921223 RepID=UPI0021660924|nr:protein scabrous [Anthonomus grandis grandis]